MTIGVLVVQVGMVLHQESRALQIGRTLQMSQQRRTVLVDGVAEIDVGPFPQQQRTVPVRHKDQWEADPRFVRAVEDARRSLDGSGRLLIRPSGTESALRIMVEGEDEAKVAALTDSLADLAAERLN